MPTKKRTAKPAKLQHPCYVVADTSYIVWVDRIKYSLPDAYRLKEWCDRTHPERGPHRVLPAVTFGEGPPPISAGNPKVVSERESEQTDQVLDRYTKATDLAHELQRLSSMETELGELCATMRRHNRNMVGGPLAFWLDMIELVMKRNRKDT